MTPTCPDIQISFSPGYIAYSLPFYFYIVSTAVTLVPSSAVFLPPEANVPIHTILN